MNNIDGLGSVEGLLEGVLGASTGIFAVGMGMLLVFLLILIAFVVAYIIGLWKLFKKCGKDGWEAIVPFYNTYVLVEIAGLNWWYFLIAIAGTIFSSLGILGQLASMAVNFFVFYNLAKKFKKEPFVWAIIGTLFSPVAVMVFGYASSFEYDASVEVSKNGPISK
jgi:signal peptidase I